jgi:hypothetical protein
VSCCCVTRGLQLVHESARSPRLKRVIHGADHRQQFLALRTPVHVLRSPRVGRWTDRPVPRELFSVKCCSIIGPSSAPRRSFARAVAADVQQIDDVARRDLERRGDRVRPVAFEVIPPQELAAASSQAGDGRGDIRRSARPSNVPRPSSPARSCRAALRRRSRQYCREALQSANQIARRSRTTVGFVRYVAKTS